MNAHKIVLLDSRRVNPGDLSWDAFRALGELTLYPETAPEDRIARIADNEIVLVDKTSIDRDVLNACPSVKMIGLFGTGCNHIDLGAARERGIPVCNVPGYSSDAVAQLATALLLELCTQVGRTSAAVQGGDWQDTSYFCAIAPGLTEIAGKTVGIVGYGAIGRAFGRIMKAMGARLLVTARRFRPELEDDNTTYVNLDELLARSDIVSLHCPLTPETRGLINRETLARMKDGAILLNTARGGLIVEADVAEALNTGKLGGLGQDAFDVEPIRPDNPLLGAPNTFLTPHIGWAPHETRARLIAQAAANVQAYQSGAPTNVVNP